MKQRNTKAHAAAVTAAIAKSATIKEYGITPNLTTPEQDAIVRLMVDAKVKSSGIPETDDMVNGQEFYLGLLMKYSEMTTPEERYEYEYARSFREFSTQEEAVDLISACM